MPEPTPALANGTRKSRRYRRGGLLLIPGLFFSSGCLYQGKEATDETVKTMAARPYDPLPDQLRTPTTNQQSSAGNGQVSRENSRGPLNATVPTDVQTAAYMEANQDPKQPSAKKFELHVPDAIPGSETPLLTMPADPTARAALLNKVYPSLPKLDEEVKPLPGPNGKHYTLSDFQRIAAENSPALRQAASDVQAARGNLIQTATYANPNFSLQSQPSNNSSTSGTFGFTVDQVIQTGGKMRLQTAAAQKAVDNAELALRRARSDLSTQVRNAYYALLVAKETMRVTRALSVLTDEVYRVQLAYTQNAGQSAAYEPAALQAQAWTARLAYKQAIATYVYTWKLLVSVISERQLPLSEVAGRIDAFVPYYEYDRVLGHVLRNHTDMLTALNGIDVQKFNLKVAQVTPWYPNLDFNIGMFKDQALLPYGTYTTFSVSAPLPFWDQNRGNILAAEAALARALEEPHRVEMALTNTLSTNFTNYKTNLDAVEYYRRFILPNQVIAYRGTLLRRQVDVNSQFGDLVAAQQALATSVTTYLGLLGTLWTSVVSVADMLQTDDLFQLSEASRLPELPDLENLPPLPCCHPFGQNGASTPAQFPTNIPAPRPLAPVPPQSIPMSSISSGPAVPTAMNSLPVIPATMNPGPVVPTAMNSLPVIPATMNPGPAVPTATNPLPVIPVATSPGPTLPAANPPPEDPWHQGPRFIAGLIPAGR